MRIMIEEFGIEIGNIEKNKDKKVKKGKRKVERKEEK